MVLPQWHPARRASPHARDENSARGGWMQERGSGSQKITLRGVKLPLYPSTRVRAAGGADDAVTWQLQVWGWEMGDQPGRPPAPYGTTSLHGVGCSRRQGTRQHPPPVTNAKSGLHLIEPDKSNNRRLVRKLLAFQQRLINSDSIKSLLINYAERYYCRL